MKRNALILLGVMLLTLSFQSCGVMFGGSRYEATIIAKDHPEADIYVNGRKAGKGEVTGTYPRNKELQVELRQDGCEPHTTTYDKSFRTGNFILSVITWGILGLGIDLGTGAAYKPDHKNDPLIEKLGDDDFVFTVEHDDCKSAAAQE